MNRAIRHVWIVSVGLFTSLFVALSLIQVVFTDNLNANQFNTRQIIENMGAARGPITVDGTPIVESVPDDESSAYDYRRVYHQPHMYSGITGFFTTAQQQGAQSGVERALNDYLSGQSDSQFFDRISALFTGSSVEGAQVELTLDPEIQELAYNTLSQSGIPRTHAIVSEVDTGNIVTMVSTPTYDPNELAVHNSEEFVENRERIEEETDGRAPYLNAAAQTTPAPGSTFKIITAAAMLESGDYEVDTELDNPSVLEVANDTLSLPNLETGNCGQRDEAEFSWVFANSCNTPFAEAAIDLGPEAMMETADAFGWNTEGLQIPTPVGTSRFDDEEVLSSDAFMALSAIGQNNVTSSPLQMNMATAAIANGGNLMRPQLVDTIRGSDLQLMEDTSPEVLNEAVSSDTAEAITEMMVETVENGTGTAAQSSQFDIAAKTGTAEVGENNDRLNSWITGFAPAEDPQYAVTIVYEDTPGTSEGAQMVGPVLRTLLEAVIEE